MIKLKVKKGIKCSFVTGNIEALVSLIKAYESATLQDIIRIDNDLNSHNYPSHKRCFDGGIIANRITGFGYAATCKVCRSVDVICARCFWGQTAVEPPDMCHVGKPRDTYYAIEKAKTASGLKKAFMKRAGFIRRELRRVFEKETLLALGLEARRK